MPKISNNSLKVSTETGGEYFKIEIFYNKDNNFYAVLPEVFNEQFDCLEEKQLKELHAKKYSKSRNNYSFNNKEFKRIVYGITESDCLKFMHSLIGLLISSTIVKRNVIILYYDNDSTTGFGSFEHNKEHPQIGIRIGLTYAVESKIADGKLKYNTNNKRELYMHGSDYTIIDDTKENRAFLELLYKNLKTLNDKLSGFTKTPETLLKFIASDNQKLIG